MEQEDDIVLVPSLDLGEFRHAAARFVKLLIRARWKGSPNVLDKKELARWRLSNIADDHESVLTLLQEAAMAFAYLNRQFFPQRGSGGIPPVNQNSLVGRLFCKLAFLVPADGGGPDWNSPLLDMIRSVRAGEAVDWSDVQWSDLTEIRTCLDKLPDPKRSSRKGLADTDRLWLEDLTHTVTLDGKRFVINNAKAYQPVEKAHGGLTGMVCCCASDGN